VRSSLHRLLVLLALALAGCLPRAHEVAQPLPEALPPKPKIASARGAFLAAEAARAAGRLDEAAFWLKKAIEADPETIQLRLMLAETLLRLGHAKEALLPLAAVEARKDELDASARVRFLLMQAQALASADRLEEALERLNEAMALAPFDAATMAARLLAAREDLDRAVDWLQRGAKRAKRKEAKAELALMQARLLLAAGRAEGALRALQRAARWAPDRAEIVRLWSDTLQKLNRADEAEEVLRRFLRRHPEAIALRHELGKLLVRQNRLGEAVRLYRELARQTNDAAGVMKMLGLLLFRLERYAEAEAAFRKALQSDPEDDESRFFFAATLEVQGRDQEAAREYRRVRPHSKSWIDAQLRLAMIELDAGKLDAALVRTKKVLDAQPANQEAWRLLAAILARKKAWRQLIEETEPALSLANVSTDLLMQRAVAFENLNDIEGVERSLRALLARKPDDPEALNFLGYAFAERGIKLDEAERLVQRALELKPNDGYYLDSLAWIYYQRGEYQRAFAVQQRALAQLETPDPVMLEHMGDILAKLGKIEDAVRYWKRALAAGHEEPEKVRAKIERAQRKQ